MVLNTKINNENKIHIDGQLIGELKGLKFLIEITQKHSRYQINKKSYEKNYEELVKRVEEIVTKADIEMDDEGVPIWKMIQ